MTRGRRVWLVIGLLIISSLLAILLRSVVYEVVILPMAFLGFQLGIWYHSLSQGIWWWLIVALVLFMLAFSLVPAEKQGKPKIARSRPKRGPVEQLAAELVRTKSGQYFKWVVANRLGKLAYQILVHRESGRARSVFDPLMGEGWQPSHPLQRYLETGLHGSFADFPSQQNPFNPPVHTPLDHNITEVVEFLESQAEKRSVASKSLRRGEILEEILISLWLSGLNSHRSKS